MDKYVMTRGIPMPECISCHRSYMGGHNCLCPDCKLLEDEALIQEDSS